MTVEGDVEHSNPKDNFELSKILGHQNHRRRTLTGLIPTVTDRAPRRRTISFNDDMLLACITCATMGPSTRREIQRPLGGGLSISEIGSYESTSSLHGTWICYLMLLTRLR